MRIAVRFGAWALLTFSLASLDFRPRKRLPARAATRDRNTAVPAITTSPSKSAASTAATQSMRRPTYDGKRWFRSSSCCTAGAARPGAAYETGWMREGG